MEVNVCSQDGNVNLYFVLEVGLTEQTCSTCLICTFQACQENGLNPKWLTTEDCLRLSPSKQDVFVCDPFEGKAFEYLTGGFKSVVLGPRCILTSLHRKESIPELPSPIHNTAMKGLVITLTGFEKEAKVEIQMLVERMAGIYSNNFHEGVTHVVAKSVGSKKYFVAVQHDIPIMTGEWVKAVWSAVSQDFREDILATDQQFLSYACPVFKGLVICVSQMQRKEKEALKKIIEENGGTYSAALEMSVTSLLIIPSPEGDKYTHACNWRIQCLTPDWIYDSVEQGSALSMEGYRVKKRGASTPNDERSLSVLPDVSLCSTIMNESGLPKISHINETVQMDTTAFGKRDSISDDRVNHGLEAVENLDIQQALKAGLFLDGCKIFLYGFSSTHMEKLRRVLNTGGATRFNQLNESLSHIVLGKNMVEHKSIISTWTSKPHIVYADWIIESMRLKRPADEAPFAHLDAETCGPQEVKKIGRISIDSLANDNETFVDEEILNQYLKPRIPDKKQNFKANSIVNDTANISSLPDSQTSLISGIFSGKTFTVSGYGEETVDDLVLAIQDRGGKIVSLSFGDQVHYSLLNIDGTGTAHSRAEEIISHYFIEDCIDQEQLVPVDYFHLPLRLREGFHSLDDCTVAISAYVGKERTFLVNMATALGATFQETFVRKAKIGRDNKASTHLICAMPEGDKYHAAIKWGIPAVTRDWLLECARSGKRAPEDAFKVDLKNSQQLDGKAIITDIYETSAGASNISCHGETAVGDVMEIGATPMNKKVRTLQEESFTSPSKIKTPDPETFRKLYPTPGVPKGNDSLSEMPTPDTPYGSTWYPNPSSRIRKGFKRLIDALPEPPPVKRRVTPGTPIEVYYKRFCDDVKETVQNYKVKDPVWLKKDGTDEKALITEGENDKTVASDIQGPLTGVVICAARKLQDQQRTLYQAVAELGGDYRWAYDHTVTHFIFQGRSNDTNKEFRLAREQGKIIVSPEWVWMCHDEKVKIDELLFPHTHNPKMSLSVVSAKSTSLTKKSQVKKKNLFGTIPDNKEELDDEEEEQEVSQSHENDSDGPENLREEQKKIALSKQLEEIEALATVTGSGRRSSSLTRSRSVNDRLRHTPTEPLQVETQPATLDVAESQNTAITWDDPQEREARLKLQNQLIRDTQEIISHNQQLLAEETKMKKNTPEPEKTVMEKPASLRKTTDHSPKRKTPYVIMLLGMMEDDKSRYIKIVEELEGTVSTAQNFDPLTTHVITAKPSRSERHLAAIASGKWMLFDSFLDDSIKAGYFVKEEPYEWGNPAATCLPTLAPGSLELKLATAARRWRITMLESTHKDGVKGAFQNMHALIHTNRDRMGAFTRLIEAGGGKVVKVRPPYREVEGITHCFVEINKVPEKIDLANFAAHQIPCLPPVFLNEYLIKDPLPDEMEYCIPEYKEILSNMSRGDQKILKRTRKK
ncbi:DNA topoisomerase 2-binding protein 1-like isoform X2 [Panulirus ornatus]|uniref:DNA topoisomerase 2-binding protein 1-like isoform X2 n=1 Tax=Panulirus ornatus TaxID=150431 RepID=UPI003A86BE0D